MANCVVYQLWRSAHTLRKASSSMALYYVVCPTHTNTTVSLQLSLSYRQSNLQRNTRAWAHCKSSLDYPLKSMLLLPPITKIIEGEMVEKCINKQPIFRMYLLPISYFD